MNYLIWISLCSTGLFCSSSTSEMKKTSELTIEFALKIPCKILIKRQLEEQGGIYSVEAEQTIAVLIKNILQGTNPQVSLKNPKSSFNFAKSAAQGLLANTQVRKIAQETMRSFKNLTPALTSTILIKNIATACASVHYPISLHKTTIALQEKELATSIPLRTAHYFALESVIQLLFIVFSPRSEPCQRMHALYLLNCVHLLGNKGESFARWRNRTNRFYFNQEGILLEFDPSKQNAQIPKRVKALNECLKILAYSHSNYLQLLKIGIAYGITRLTDYYQSALENTWQNKKTRFFWHYAAGLFKEATSIDVMYIRTVDPQRIFSHQENKDLLSFMHLTSNSEIQATQGTCIEKAKCLIRSYENAEHTHILNRFYKEVAKRTAL